MTIMCGRPRTAVGGAFPGVEFSATSDRYALADIASDLVATEDCYIKFGDNTVVATVNDTYFEAGSEAFNHPTGATHIAAIRVSTDGTLTVTPRSTAVTYGTPQAAEFDGSSALRGTLSGGAQARPATIACFFNAPINSTQNSLVSVANIGWTQYFNAYLSGNGSVFNARSAEGGSGVASIISIQDVAPDTWIPELSRFESATARHTWINGVIKTSTFNIVTGPTGADTIAIGARTNLADNVTADIVRVVLVDGVVSDAESVLFEAGDWPQAIWGTSVIAHYEFLSGTPMADISGNYSDLSVAEGTPTYASLPAGLLATLDYPDKLDGAVSEEYPDDTATTSAALPSGEGYVRVRTPYAIWLLVGASPTATRGAGNEVAVPAGQSLQIVGSAANFSVINQTPGEFGSVQISGLTTQ